MNKVFDQGRENTSTILQLTSAQESIYFAHLLDIAGISLNIAHYREINGKIDADLLFRAIDLVLDKTPAYRSVVKIINETPFLEIKHSVSSNLKIVELSTEEFPEKIAKAWVDQEWKKAFDLSTGPLFKYAVVKLGIGQFYLFTCVHHIIVDGSGVFQFERNVFDTYAALQRGENVNAPVGPDNAFEFEKPYTSSSEFNEDKTFWKTELADVEPQISLSGRPSVVGRLFNRARSSLSPNSILSLKEFCHRNKISLQRALVVIGALYYTRMTGQRDFLIEIPVSLRRTREDFAAVDMRSSSVLLRLSYDPATTLGEFIKIFSSQMRGALRHQRYRREFIQKDFGRDKNFALFSINILPSSRVELGKDISIKTNNLSNGPVKDVSINIYLGEYDSEVLLELDCNSSLYSKAESALHLDRIKNLMYSCASSTADQVIDLIPLIDVSERNRVISTFNDTQQEIPSTTLPDLFGRQVEKSPEATALIFGDEEVSYRELDCRANQLARYLISHNIGPEDIVAIGLDRSVEMVVALLGVLKSGAAYLPLDPDYPVERLTFMLTDSNAKRLVTTKEIYDRLLGLSLIHISEPTRPY